MTKSNNSLTIIDDIKTELASIIDGSEYSVPMSKVFGRGVMNKSDSFGNLSLQENADRVDEALNNTADLQKIWNHSHTQWSWKHINMSFNSPWMNMRQIAAEIARKRQALNEAKWKQVNNEIKIRKFQEKLENPDINYWDEIDLRVKIAQLKEGMAEGTHYIEGAMKDILALNEIFEQLKLKTLEFSEADIEREESKSHLMKSISQCIRDIRMTGVITKGEQEYMEQIGVNPSKMMVLLKNYVENELKDSTWDTDNLINFVKELANDLIDNHKVDVKRMSAMGFGYDVVEDYTYNKKIAGTRSDVN
jgi:hypothetical protein